jgi:RluA family pseudouridine synthase
MSRIPDDDDFTPPTETVEVGTPNCLVVGLDCRSMNPYRFLRVRFPAIPRALLQEWLTAGLVTVNGHVLTESFPLRAGDMVEIAAALPRVPSRRRADFSVLYQDDAMIIVDKPSGLATEPEKQDRGTSLLSRLKEQLGGTPEKGPRTVHRLEKQASGVVVLALGRTAKQALVEEFAERRVQKDFLALVSGRFTAGLVDQVDHLVPKGGRTTRVEVVLDRGKEARTQFLRRALFRGYSLVRARPITARAHQIRVQLRQLGHAIVGDSVYGGEPHLKLSSLKSGYRPGRGERERPLLQRLALHAARIQLRSPATGEEISCSAPLPRDLSAALRQLCKNSGAEEDPIDWKDLELAPLGRRELDASDAQH